ncbi:hypothetical protein A2W24_00220 [Microgenomates group bacterium RBG_16_45_19]|nr:MAG: hypothetical protein A2W24_00220 [Microgenomates group bacterium RBG_16_45_19]
MILESVTIVEIKPSAPFHFDTTFHKPAHFTSGDNYWESGIRWQTFRFLGKYLGVIFRNTGSVEIPKIEVEIYSSRPLANDLVAEFIQEIQYRYNLNFDLNHFYQHFASDTKVGPVIKKMRGLRPGHQDSLYEYLIIGIVLQNCTVRRSIQMMQILFEHYGTLLEFAGKQFWCFWDLGDLKTVPEAELRSLKLGYRAKSIKKTDDSFAKGVVNENELRQQDLDTQKTKLLNLYGIGPATVGYLLFDVFHHWDYLDHISPWEQKIYSKLIFDQDPNHPVTVRKLFSYFNRFGPYKQLVIHYLWEDLWWQRKNQPIPWLEKLIRA